MRIALDVMGSDKGPSEIVNGALMAQEYFPEITKIFLVGDENLIKSALKNISSNKIQVVHANQVIEMDDHPAEAYRSKKEASITIATKLVKDGEADAVISAGNTGAQLASSLFELGRISGIKRPAISVFIPTLQGDKLLMDAGANTKVNEEILHQFAIMGGIYYEIKYHNKPSIGLISNGSEPTKGTELVKNTWKILNEDNRIDFYGNVEGRDISKGTCDVYVCDGFTGNIILKTMEGLGKSLFKEIKSLVQSSIRYKIGALFLKPLLRQLHHKMDPNRVGGAPLLGVNGISIVCHGSSSRRAILSAFETALSCYQDDMINKIKNVIQ